MGEDLRAGRGGITRLAAFLEEHSEAVEADLARFYGQDLRDMWRPRGGASRLTWRRLGVLLEHLPPESATKTAVRDELDPAELAEIAARPRNRYGSWSHLELLVGQVIDHLAYVAYAVYVAGGGKPQLPTPYPRPGVDTGTRRPDPRAVAYLQNLLDRHAEAHQPKGA